MSATVTSALKGFRGACGLAGTVALILAGAFVVGCAARGQTPANPTLRFDVITKTTQKLDSLVWTGRQFLYVQNTANTVWAAPPAGYPLAQFATMPKLVEETRCILSPGRQGFPAGTIFCHSPDNKIYEISPNGSSVTVFASLPNAVPACVGRGVGIRYGRPLRLPAARGDRALRRRSTCWRSGVYDRPSRTGPARRQLWRPGRGRRARDRTG